MQRKWLKVFLHVFIAGHHTCLCVDSWWVFPPILDSVKIKLSITLAGTIPDNTSGLDETLCSGVELHALFTSCWEVSPIEDVVVLLTSCWEVSPIKLFTSCWEVSPIILNGYSKLAKNLSFLCENNLYQSI